MKYFLFFKYFTHLPSNTETQWSHFLPFKNGARANYWFEWIQCSASVSVSPVPDLHYWLFVPSKVKQMECYHSVSVHLVLHTLITTIHTGHPPASTCMLQTQTCNICNSSDFKCIHLISIWFLALAYSGQAERGWWPSQKYRTQSFQLSKTAGQTSDTLSNHETLFHKTSLNPVWRFDTGFGQKSFSP